MQLFRQVTSMILSLSPCCGCHNGALKSAPDQTLDEVSIGQEIQKALGFLAAPEFAGRADEWLLNTGLKGGRH